MHAELPTLAFLPLDKLVVHERADDQRSRPLILRIRSSGVFQNPPIVSPLQDGSGRYMVLDGANRTVALREMGFPHVLAQVVEPDDPGLGLQTWNHVVWEMNPERFLNNIRNLPGIHMALASPEDDARLLDVCDLALVRSCRGHTFSLCSDAEDMEKRIELLNLIVDSYRETGRLDRTSSRDVALLRDVYPQLSGLVIFPQFQIHEVMRLAGQGYLLPSGVTRFTIAPRALHLNYPLEALEADRPLEEKNAELHRWLQERLARRGVRYYAEPTFLFDE